MDPRSTNPPQGSSRRHLNLTFLPGASSLKDDLHAIFTLNQEVGSAVFSVLQLLENYQETAETEIPDNLHEVSEALKIISAKVEEIKQLSTFQKDTQTQFRKDIDEFNQLRPRLNKAISVIFKKFGYSESGEEIPETLRNFERHQKIWAGIFWNVIGSILCAIIFWLFTQSQESEIEKRVKMETQLRAEIAQLQSQKK